MKSDSSDDLKTSEFILRKLLIITLGFVLLKLVTYHFQVIGNFFPNEYRESAILLVTDLLVKGGNPYDLINQPQYTSVYGIFYHIIVVPFAKLFGTNFPVHRSISAAFIFASCFVLFAAMRWRKISLVFALSATLLLYSHLLYFTTPLAKPDSLGFFLFLSSLLIPWRYQYSRSSLLSSTILGVLGFLTKPYFILSLLYLNLYLFIFKSKKKGIEQGLLSLLVLVLAILIVNESFETYFNNIILINLFIAGHDFVYAIKQLYAYIQINYGIILIFFVYIFTDTNIDLLKHPITNIKSLKRIKVNFGDIKKPLINLNIDLIEFCLIVSLLIFLSVLGQHWGSWLVYINHLISPFLIFLTFDLLNKKLRDKKVTLINLIAILLILLNLLSVSSSQVLPQLDYGLKDWNNLRGLLSRHQHIFNSPAIASILIEQGKKVHDSGQSQYFVLSTQRPAFWDIIVRPKRREIQMRYQQFIQEITNSVKLKKYDLIVLTKGYSPFISEKLLKRYYQYKKTLNAPMSVKTKQSWKLDIWKPKAR